MLQYIPPPVILILGMFACLQYFNKEFTKSYLKRYLTKAGYDMKVYYNQAGSLKRVRINLDMGKKYAFMTSHWMEVVEAENYEEGEFLMFWFRRASEGGLKCYVDRISPGAFGIPEEEHLKLLEAHGL